MGIIVRAKRIDLFDETINLSFALDFVDSETKIALNGVYNVDGGDVLVGCTDKGRLCVQGSSSDLDWMHVHYTVSFIDSNGGHHTEQKITTEQLLQTPIDSEISDYSNIVGFGKVGYMIIT